MPKATFDKIGHEKKERVLVEAARLFAERGYNATDMAELAERCSVAKGSLYNYFASKEELYLYVCRDGLERSRRAVYGGINPRADIYQQVEHIFRRGVDFARSHPEYVTLYLNVSSAGMAHMAEAMSLEVEKFTADHLKRLLKHGVKQGIVRPNIDVNLSAFLINGVYILLVTSLVSRHLQIRMKEYLELDGELDDLSIESQLERTLEMIEGMLRPASADG